MVAARCMRCRMQVEVANPQEYVTKNKMIAIRGTCPKCGTSVSRIVRKA